MRLMLLAIIVTVGSLAAGAQDQAVRTPFRSEANYIRVDMYTTRDGRPVTDLQASEVEILDQGERQTIDRFEHVLVAHAAAPQTAGAAQAAGGGEPATVADARAPAPDGRARLFVLFLDSYHVDQGLSRAIGQKLANALDTLIGADDLIAVMTPEMRVEDVTFTRRTKTIEETLRTVWGMRDRWVMSNAQEAEYASCYPHGFGGIAQDMTLRRREKLSLDALEALVEHLGTLREERKAVITISNGWRLFGENTLSPSAEKAKAPPPGFRGANPSSGGLTTGGTVSQPSTATTKCEADRFALAQLRLEQRFREILDRANRTNTSFYPIDPRGAPVFDEDIVPVAGTNPGANPPLGLVEERERLNARRTSLLTMAESTDGLAIVNARDLDAGMRRIGDDLSSYYLVGFRSTRKLDGKFHRLTVRVKRPGLQVRARRGYLASTSKGASNTGAAPVPALAAASSPAVAPASALASPLAALNALASDRPLRAIAAAGWTSDGAARIWVAAEAQTIGGRNDWRDGAQVSATVADGAGTIVAAGALSIPAGTTSVRLELRPSAPLAPGEYQVTIRSTSAGAGSMQATDTVRLVLPAAPAGAGALFTRRGPTTGSKDVPAADPRFRRTDRISIDVPAVSSDAGSGRLLDRAGHPLPIPVETAVRQDAGGLSWRTAQVSLAPLAPGDYLIQITAGAETAMAAIRVLP